jgi:hypothetical protein
LQFSYSNTQIREICENEQHACSKLGTKIALSLQSRLADLSAADSVYELPLGQPKEFEQGVFKIDLEDNFILIFGANHVSNPTLKNGDIDWASITRIKIIKIENTDDYIS